MARGWSRQLFLVAKNEWRWGVVRVELVDGVAGAAVVTFAVAKVTFRALPLPMAITVGPVAGNDDDDDDDDERVGYVGMGNAFMKRRARGGELANSSASAAPGGGEAMKRVWSAVA